MMLIAVFAFGLSLLSLKINERSFGVGVMGGEKVIWLEKVAIWRWEMIENWNRRRINWKNRGNENCVDWIDLFFKSFVLVQKFLLVFWQNQESKLKFPFSLFLHSMKFTFPNTSRQKAASLIILAHKQQTYAPAGNSIESCSCKQHNTSQWQRKLAAREKAETRWTKKFARAKWFSSANE